MAPAAGMIPLGFGSFVRADRVVALLPLAERERGGGRRTYVHVDGVPEPIVASRSERAILGDIERGLAELDQQAPAREPADRARPRLFGRQRRP